ncbi:MAG: membrane integrity-associated transporter subunit PqiC [Verrucomicrobiae bacterium]|nr:membrane integrity-associated transporter subunit PqiC [Verrucomicrobiae bacterium]
MSSPVRPFSLVCLTCLAIAGALSGGCLPKPNTLATRSYVLSPLSTPPSDAIAGPAIGIGVVRMPAYLLKPSIAVRSGTNEIHYLESSIWAERLDTTFQRALAANLAAQVPTDRIRIGSWSGDEVDRAVYVSVDRFDVDTNGTGTLQAWWRLTAGGGDPILRYGNPRLTESGPAPAEHPEAIASTLSRLAERLAEAIAEAIRASVSPRAPAAQEPLAQ